MRVLKFRKIRKKPETKPGGQSGDTGQTGGSDDQGASSVDQKQDSVDNTRRDRGKDTKEKTRKPLKFKTLG